MATPPTSAEQPPQLPNIPTSCSPIIVNNDLAGVKPPSFVWDSSDLPQAFKKFRRYCEIFLSTPTYSSKKPEEIVNFILLWMGPRGVEIFDNLKNLTEADKRTPTKVWEAFSTYFEPKTNYRLARFQLREMVQQQGQSIDAFLTQLTAQAQKCKFPDPTITDDNILDQIIKGTAHDTVRKKFLDTDPDKLTLDAALNMARTFEATAQQILRFNQPQTAVNTVSRQRTTHTPTSKTVFSSSPSPSTLHKCRNCGGHHDRFKCPAHNSQCSYCHKFGHWAQVCLTKARRDVVNKAKTPAPPPTQTPRTNSRRRGQHKQRNVHSVEQQEEPIPYDSIESFHFDSIGRNDSPTQAFAELNIKLRRDTFATLKGKVDTGAQGNILPMRTYKNMYPQHIDCNGNPTLTKPNKDILTAYCGNKVKHYGTIDIPCQYKDSKWRNTTFYVAQTTGSVIYGLPTCAALGIVVLNCSVNLNNNTEITSAKDLQTFYSDRFKGIGKFPNKCHLTLKEDAHPIKHPPRKAPILLQERIKEELKRMEDLEVIRKVSENTDWISSITYVHKANGALRICLDPKDLNQNLKRGQHHIPTMEELGHKFAEATVFSKLDARSGYWCIELDTESQPLTTFNTPYGHYCFQRLPFGLNVSQDIFQAAMDENLEPRRCHLNCR